LKTYKLTINGDRYDARVVEYSGTHARININGADYVIQIEDDSLIHVPKLPEQEKAVPMAPSFSSGFDGGSGELRAPIPGVIVSIPVKEGDRVKKGQTIIIIEAMKMQSEIAAPVDGSISKIMVKERAPVQEGDLLMQFTGDESKPKPEAKALPKKSSASAPEPVQSDGMILAPIPGTVIDIKVKPGDLVDKDSVVLILEAMKMESEIHSSLVGRVRKIHVSKGASVSEGDPLVELEV